MNKFIKILFFILPMQLFSDMLAPDISFVDLPSNAKAGGLANTYLSDIGCPSNIILNPANIWFANRVNNKVNTKNSKILNNIVFRTNISNVSFMNEDNITNLMGSIQYSDKLTLGFGYIENNINNINNYDSNANYNGEAKYKQSATSVGLATKLIGTNIGISATYFNNTFNGNDDIDENINKLLMLTTGFSLNEITIRKPSYNNKDKSFFKTIFSFLPHTISFQMTSRILHYNDIATNSLSKNIFGTKSTYDLGEKSKVIFIADYHSNKDVSDNFINIGTGYHFSPDWGSFSINAGINDINNNKNLTYGLEFTLNNLGDKINFSPDISISLSNIETSWGGTYTVATFKYAYDKK